MACNVYIFYIDLAIFKLILEMRKAQFFVSTHPTSIMTFTLT